MFSHRISCVLIFSEHWCVSPSCSYLLLFYFIIITSESTLFTSKSLNELLLLTDVYSCVCRLCLYSWFHSSSSSSLFSARGSLPVRIKLLLQKQPTFDSEELKMCFFLLWVCRPSLKHWEVELKWKLNITL